MFTENSLYRNFVSGNINQKEYNIIHHCIDDEHTLSWWYEVDNYTISKVYGILLENGKKRTSALMRKLATLA